MNYFKKASQKNKYLDIVGKYNYFIDINIKNESPYQNSSLSISVFTNESKKIPISVKYKWYRIKSTKLYSQINISSNFYHISSMDIGSLIKVEVIPIETKQYTGTAEITFGPIKIEPTLKNTLENILSVGGSKFPITWTNASKEKENMTLMLTNDHIRLISGSFENEKSVKFKYFLGQPQIMLNNENPIELEMFFKGSDEFESLKNFLSIPKNNNCFEFIFQTSSRNTKDLIILSLRTFSVRNYLINSRSISHLESLFEDEINLTEKNTIKKDLLLEIDEIKQDLNSLVEINKELICEKQENIKEIKSLEEELEKTIETYNSLIQEMKKGNVTINESLLDISMIGKKDEIEMKKKIKNLENEKLKLEKSLKSLTNELEVQKNFDKNKGFFNETRIIEKNDIKIIELEAKYESIIEELKKKLENNNEKPKNNDLNQIEKKYMDTKKLNELLLEEIKSFKLKNDNLIKEIEKNKKNNLTNSKYITSEKLLNENDNYAKEISNLKTKLKSQNLDSEKIFKKNEFLEKEILELKIEIDDYRLQIKNSSKKNFEIEEEKSLKENLKIEIKELKNKLETVQNEANYYKKESMTFLESRKKNQERIFELETELSDLSLKYNELEKNKTTNRENYNQEENKLIIDDLNGENKTLIRKVELLNEETLEFKKKNEFLIKENNNFIQRLEQIEINNENSLNEYKNKIDILKNENLILTDKNDLLTKELNSKSLNILKSSNILNKNTNVSYDHENEIKELQNTKNNLEKKIESLQKELELTNKQNNKLTLDNLIKTNQRLMIENGNLMDQLKKMGDEFDLIRNTSRLDETDNYGLKNRVRELEKENEYLSNEKDKLIVELSKMMIKENNKF